MKNYYEKLDEWQIIETNLHPYGNRIYESIMSLGNGYMGMRGNFEEDYSGNSLQGTYIAGVYYPDKTRVGWWKNGYPEYFAKVLNAPNFIGVKVALDNEKVDIAKCEIKDFQRILDMHHGYIYRTFILIDSKGRETKFEIKRFLSIVNKEIAAINYNITPLNHKCKINLCPYIDGEVSNEDSNYDEKFWTKVNRKSEENLMYLTMETKKTKFNVSFSSKYEVLKNNEKYDYKLEKVLENDKFVGNEISILAEENSTITFNKYIAVTNNRYFENEQLVNKSLHLLEKAFDKGFNRLFEEHSLAWEKIWNESDIIIKDDVKAQQAIRFNIFQLKQTYTGEDPRLNIGPKGFTGEKYGGSTYWDTEAYCLPFYLSTSDEKISKNLLLYRYNHLEKAKENAKKLGLKGALYPMVTMNGEECHNEWEITFEEIHRNAAIAYAIFNYVRYTGDKSYLKDYGFEVLTEISRFWADRCSFNQRKDAYMILGVTGPNEYDNNINNNWYTNTMAVWNLEYTLKVKEFLKENFNDEYIKLKEKLNIDDKEYENWKDIIKKMYCPYVEDLKIFEQQDGYMDKEQKLVKDIPKEELPLNQHWSWDRILRSPFIKQADVLQGLFFLGDKFDLETKKRNFDFYEPRTLHESSLSPCIHCIIASEIGYEDKAYELYLRTARFDLDNYNNDTCDGLHITSMAGTWMSIVYGFGGMRVEENTISFNPFIPKDWGEYSFKTLFRNHLLKITVNKDYILIKQEKGLNFKLKVYDKEYEIAENGFIKIKYNRGGLIEK